MNVVSAVARWLVPVLIVGSFLAYTRFWVMYVLRVPTWRLSPEGRYMVVSKMAFSLFLGLATLGVFWPGFRAWSGRDVIRMPVYLILFGVAVWINVLSDRAQRDRREEAGRRSAAQDQGE
jgi:hypothetical protein